MRLITRHSILDIRYEQIGVNLVDQEELMYIITPLTVFLALNCVSRRYASKPAADDRASAVIPATTL